jgi:diguanylate cyclase
MKDGADWREKYLAALERIETQTNTWKQVDDVLRRIIKRLCIAARGIDRGLDEELALLSGALRADESPAALETRLTRLSAAVAALDAPAGNAPPTESAPSKAKLAAPDRQNAPEVPNEPEASNEPQMPNGREVPTAAEAPNERATLAEPLLVILDCLGLEDQTGAEVAALRARLAAPPASDEFENALWQLGDLVASEQRRLAGEKSEVERLLKQITSRLGEFTTFLSEVDADQGEAERSGRELSEQLRGEVEGIGSTVRLATSLGALQQTVAARLEAIDSHLRSFRARASERVQIYHERAERMRARVAQLETTRAALEKSLAREQRLALRDGLTGIANRMAYDERIALEWKRWRRFRQPLSLVTWDLDRFKTLNDTYGHRAGDRVLRAFASLLRAKVRETDFVGRYGGEEFVMLLIGTRAADANIVAEGIREEIGRLGFHFRGAPVGVTASCGIAEARDDETPERFFDRADRAMYRAKEAGRNRCVVDE